MDFIYITERIDRELKKMTDKEKEDIEFAIEYFERTFCNDCPDYTDECEDSKAFRTALKALKIIQGV